MPKYIYEIGEIPSHGYVFNIFYLKNDINLLKLSSKALK